VTHHVAQHRHVVHGRCRIVAKPFAPPLTHTADLGILRAQDVFGELATLVVRNHHVDELLIEGGA